MAGGDGLLEDGLRIDRERDRVRDRVFVEDPNVLDHSSTNRGAEDGDGGRAVGSRRERVRGEGLTIADGVGKDDRFWKLADNLNKLYPAGTEERRWVEGVLARKKGLGL